MIRLDKLQLLNSLFSLNVPLLHLEAVSHCHPTCAFLVQAVAVHTIPRSVPCYPLILTGKSCPPLQLRKESPSFCYYSCLWKRWRYEMRPPVSISF